MIEKTAKIDARGQKIARSGPGKAVLARIEQFGGQAIPSLSPNPEAGIPDLRRFVAIAPCRL